MTPVETVTLWIHIAAGVVALLTGVIALVTRKGGLRHRQAGRTYVASMGVVVITVLPLLVLDPSPNRVFLTLIAIFSGYFAFSGYRVLSRKRPVDNAEPVDWAAAVFVVGACLILGGWGGQLAPRRQLFRHRHDRIWCNRPHCGVFGPPSVS